MTRHLSTLAPSVRPTRSLTQSLSSSSPGRQTDQLRRPPAIREAREGGTREGGREGGSAPLGVLPPQITHQFSSPDIKQWKIPELPACMPRCHAADRSPSPPLPLPPEPHTTLGMGNERRPNDRGSCRRQSSVVVRHGSSIRGRERGREGGGRASSCAYCGFVRISYEAKQAEGEAEEEEMRCHARIGACVRITRKHVGFEFLPYSARHTKK